jgi:hypothetical protein
MSYRRAMTDAQIALLETGPLVEVGSLPELIGWELKPEGLCRNQQCVIVTDRDALCPDGRIDLREVAGLLDRPVAIDSDAGLVALGATRDGRRGALNDLQAPDFTLPDLDGTSHSLADHRSKKKLLVAFSSW